VNTGFAQPAATGVAPKDSVAAESQQAQAPKRGKKWQRQQQQYDSTRARSKKPAAAVQRYQQSIDSLQQHIQSKKDSVLGLANPHQWLVRGYDSLRQRLDSLKQNALAGRSGKSLGRAKAAQQRLNKSLQQTQANVNGKLQEFNSRGANLPATPALGGNVAGGPAAALNANLQLPNANLTGSLPSLNQPATAGMQQVLQKPQEGLTALGNSRVVKDGQSLAGNINKYAGQAGGYANDVNNLAQGNVGRLEQLPQTLEGKVAGMGEVAGFQKEMAPVQDYTEMLKKWNEDPHAARALTVSKAKEEAINHFAGREQEVKAAMSRLSRLKGKASGAETVLDMFSKRTNPMKGKTFWQRLEPGVSLQLQAATNQWLDINPSIGYRVSGRFTAGIGWNERVAGNWKKKEWVPAERAWGVRSYVEFRVKDGFYLRGEAERLNAKVTSPFIQTLEPDERRWVNSYFAGFKRSFLLSRHLKGNVQLLYNLYSPLQRSPYATRLNGRIGFELNREKKPER
jgi:hypothetical protein